MHLVLLLVQLAVAVDVPSIAWEGFFSSVTPRGVEFSERVRSLNGHRVRLRGYSALSPPIPHGILLTHFPYDEPHEVEETDVPFDAVAVYWRKGLALPPVPRRPTVEGILRVGNRDTGPVTVALSLDDATPVVSR